jgi:hypothetical protein
MGKGIARGTGNLVTGVVDGAMGFVSIGYASLEITLFDANFSSSSFHVALFSIGYFLF